MAGRPKTRAKREAATAVAEQAGQAADPETSAPTTQGADTGQPERPPADRPPRRGRPRKAATAPPADGLEPADRRPASIRKIQDGLVQLFTIAGLGTSMFVDDFDGQVIALNADRLARAWADLAQQSPAVRRALEALLMGSAWGSAIGTTAMVAIPVMVRHGIAPPEVMAMASGQGVKVPNIGQPEQPAERPPAPAAFTPEPAPAGAPSEAERHPLDGSPLNGQAPADPTAPLFPRADQGEAAA
jgi:hypothetical protein